jgi:hypothetical protein
VVGLSKFFLVLAFLSVFWGIVSCIVIASYLSARGVKINYVFFRVLVLKYIRDYHAMTMRDTGRPGPWFYSYVTSMMLAVGFAILGLALR